MKKSFISRLRVVNGGKLEIEVSAQITAGRGGVASLLNASDDRFKARFRKGWVSGEPSDLAANIPALAADIKKLDGQAVNTEITYDEGEILAEMGGQVLTVQITEGLTPITKYQIDMLAAGTPRGMKVYPEGHVHAGSVITKDGNPVYSASTVVLGTATHTFIEHDRIVADVSETEDAVPVGLSSASE